jgi:hypothetical protein
MNNNKVAIACVLSLLAGVGLGFLVNRPAPVKENVPTKIEKKQKAAVKDIGNEAIIRGLRKKIADLETKLQNLNQTPQKEEEKKVEEKPNPERRMPGFSIAEMRKFAEEFKKRDPQGYINMTNRMAQGMARRQEKNISRLELLSSFNVASMSEKQKAVHETYQDLLSRQVELENILNPQNTDLTDEDREKAFKEMRELHRDIHKYAREERKNLLSQTGIDLGVGSENVSTFVEMIETVYDVTSEGWGGRGRGGHHQGSMPFRQGWR